MRKLDRAAGLSPPCLTGYDHNIHKWDDVLAGDRAQIRASLEMVQGKRCAYCEGDIVTLGQHIEHFRRKSEFPELTFAWNNLYWSCDQNDSCGHFKDRGGMPYDVDDLIEPCIDEPDNFLVFRSDGTISVRNDIQNEEKRRANETLRVFSLNPQWGRLRNMRQAAVAGYIHDANEAADAGFSQDEIRAYFAEAIEFAKGLPFFTAIRHVLTERQ